MQEFHSTYVFTTGEPIPNWNFNPNANVDNGIEIPYFDMTGEGTIDNVDYNVIAGAEVGTLVLTEAQIDRMKYRADGSINTNTSDTLLLLYEMATILNHYEEGG